MVPGDCEVRSKGTEVGGDDPSIKFPDYSESLVWAKLSTY